MTEAKLIRTIRTWQSRLKLDHVAIEIDLENACHPDALATVSPSGTYDIATIQFGSDWRRESDFQMNRIVVHELIHVLFRDYKNAILSISTAGVLSAQVEAIWADNCHDAEEQLIDRLAWRMVEVGGCVK